jgi:hypothetical protein
MFYSKIKADWAKLPGARVRLLQAKGDVDEKTLLVFPMAIGDLHSPSRADNPQKICLILKIMGLHFPPPAASGLKLDGPVGVKAIKKMGQKRIPSIR